MRKQLAKALFDLSPVSHKENAYTDFKYFFFTASKQKWRCRKILESSEKANI